MYITWVTGAATLSAAAPQAPSNNLTSQVRLCSYEGSCASAMPHAPLTFLLRGKAGHLCTLLVPQDAFMANMDVWADSSCRQQEGPPR